MVVVIAIVMVGSTAVKGVWQVKDELALDYLIIPSSNSGVEDLWVDWKQSFLLLEELTPKFSKIWTLNGISYCPLLDILQAAVKSNGLARELLDSLVQPLFEGEHFEEVELENEEGGLWQACRSEREDEEQRTMIDEPQNQDEARLRRERATHAFLADEPSQRESGSTNTVLPTIQRTKTSARNVQLK